MSAVTPADREGLAPGTEAPASTRTRIALPAFGRAALPIAAAVVLIAAGGVFIAAPKSSVATDDAYTRADTTAIAPRVRGLISKVLVRDNQEVRAGDPLVQIDPEEFDARVASARADLRSALAKVASARSALVSLGASEALAASTVTAAETSIRSADATKVRAGADRARYDRLVASGAVAEKDADLYRANAITAEAEAAHSRAELAVRKNEARVVEARRPDLLAAVEDAEAGAARARSALDLALQDQTHALVRAPLAGVVGDRQAEVGAYVAPGARLMTLVPSRSLYVVANFKETETSRMLVGQPVEVRIDALPSRVLKGRVESFAPGSGSEFSLLPFEPGTGNFTKIVQRVPVRIRFDPDQPDLLPLRPGLSVNAKVALTAR